MIHAIAIDDEPLPLELIKQYCARIDFISLDKSFTKVSAAREYLAENEVDLLFLDIQMPAVTGIEFYKSLRQNTMVIFTTAFSEYAIDGFNLNAVDYLLKPFSFKRFMEAVTKARSFHDFLKYKTALDRQYIYVKSDYSIVQIDINEILLLESFADYLDIHLQKDKKVRIRMPLKNIMEKLPADKFVRVHRSYIVPLQHIEKVRKKTIFVAGREIPITASYEEDFFNRFSQ
ncbi:LytR/AlgR family response regulator transcription factor [Flavobacterium sp. RHBU_3]|uniref:LytR/AlgR family response regulator transcription factor n=1 Tax=Flavobacterium sp. RHBU_3 TaxID=3391184 RepID=UPI003984E6E4